MNLTDLAVMRLYSQQITGTKFQTAKDLVGWMGAIQAQDYAMAKWAIGIRLPNSQDEAIENVFNRGEILRTHPIRSTWHFVSADAIYWMLLLTAPQTKAALASRQKELGLSETVFRKSSLILENALRDGKHLTREELAAEFEKAKIATGSNRLSHLLVRAELDEIVCSGVIKGGKQTYALLEERVPRPKSLAREEALAKLAQRYFYSHGPASLQDFAWWSGLHMSDARKALELVKSGLVAETVGAQTYWLPDSSFLPRADKARAVLLPAFDELIISYKDRSASIPFENQAKMVSENGIFRPIIVINGQVIGIWKREVTKDQVIMKTEFFKPPDRTTLDLVEKAAFQLGLFLGKTPVLAAGEDQ